MKLTKKELDKVLASVTEDVAELLKSETEEGEKLSKADPGAETAGEEKPEGSSAEPPKEEPSASPSPEASGDGSAPPAAEGTPPAPEGEGSAPSGDPAADQQGGPEALEAEYAQLPPEELKAHFLACKSALMKVLAGGAGPEGSAPAGAPGAEGSAPAAPPAAPPAGAPPAPEGSAPPAPPAGPSPEGEPPMGKKEIKMSGNGSGGKISAGKMAKSEDVTVSSDVLARLEKAEKALEQVEGLKKTIAEKDAVIASFEEKVGQVAGGIAKLIERPIRKSVASVTYAAKPGSEPASKSTIDPSSLSKSEVTQKLRAATASESLSKKDRDLVSGFMLGTVTIDKVAHLLTE